MKSSVMTQNLVCLKTFEVFVTKTFIKSLQLSQFEMQRTYLD